MLNCVSYMVPEWRKSHVEDRNRKTNCSWPVQQRWSSFFREWTAWRLVDNCCIHFSRCCVTIAIQWAKSRPGLTLDDCFDQLGWLWWHPIFKKKKNPLLNIEGTFPMTPYLMRSFENDPTVVIETLSVTGNWFLTGRSIKGICNRRNVRTRFNFVHCWAYRILLQTKIMHVYSCVWHWPCCTKIYSEQKFANARVWHFYACENFCNYRKAVTFDFGACNLSLSLLSRTRPVCRRLSWLWLSSEATLRVKLKISKFSLDRVVDFFPVAEFLCDVLCSQSEPKWLWVNAYLWNITFHFSFAFDFPLDTMHVKARRRTLKLNLHSLTRIPQISK